MTHIRNVQREADVPIPKAGETFIADDGTVSQVLDDVVDSSYEPEEEELNEYAQWIGMTLPEDEDLLWIAREGLKAPLPKEWKPCRTNTDDIYYFNFRTGESRVDHPMDGLFRKKYQDAKQRRQSGTGRCSSPGLGVNGFAKNKGNDGGALSIHNPALGQAGIKPGVFGAGLSSTRRHESTSDASGLALGRSPLTNFSPAASTPLAQVFLTGDGNSAHGSLALSRGPASFSSPLAPTFSASFSSSNPVSSAQPQFISESERLLEERIRTELKESFEAEKLRLQSLQSAKVSSMRKLYEEEMREIQEEVTQCPDGPEVRTDCVASEKQSRDEQIARARARCEDRYGSQLTSLEQEAEALEKQLAKLAAEEERLAELSRGERLTVEKQAATEKEKALQKLAADLKQQHAEKEATLKAAFDKRRDELKAQNKETLTRTRQELDKAFRQKEVSIVMATEAARRKLEEEKRQLEADVRNKAKKTSMRSITQQQQQHKLSSRTTATALAEIDNKKEADCAALREKAQEEQKAVRERGDALLSALRRRLCVNDAPAPAFVERPNGGPPSSNSSHVRGSVASASPPLEEKLAALRARYAKEKQDALAALEKEREVKLAVPNARAEDSVVATGSSANPTLQALKAYHTAEQKRVAACYEALEEEWAARLASELAQIEEDGNSLSDSLVQAVVDADMDLYTKQVFLRRERVQQEFQYKKEKSIAEHASAMEAYKKRCDEHQLQRVQKEQDMRKEKIASEASLLVEKEKAALIEGTEAALSRARAAYIREKEVVREEVDEEMDVYLKTEEEKIRKEASSITATHSNPPAVSTAQPGSCNSKLEELRAQLRETAALHQRELDQLRAVVEAKQREAEELEACLLRDSEGQQMRLGCDGGAALSSSSVLHATHMARMTALEEGYHSQEDTLKKELREWEKKTVQLRHSSDHAAGPKRQSVIAQGDAAQAGDRGAFCLSDALRYSKEHHELLEKRQLALQRAKMECCSKEGWGGDRTVGMPLLASSASAQMHSASTSLQRCASALPGMSEAREKAFHSAGAYPISPLVSAMDHLNNKISHITSCIVKRRESPERDKLPSGHRYASSTPLFSTKEEGIDTRALERKWDRMLREYFQTTTTQRR